MPELPEVETIVRELNAEKLCGRTIIEACVLWERTLSDITVDAFLAKIKGEKIHTITRHGKWLHFELSHHHLYIHLRMTGKFFLNTAKALFKHERIRLQLDDQRILHFDDQRKFGRWQLIDKQASAPAIGVDPLSSAFTWEFFKALLVRPAVAIKAFLLNQKYLSGLGNIYVDESLWEASIHPLRRTNSLSQKEAKALFSAIPKVLQKGIDNTGTTLGNMNANYYSVSGRRGNNQQKLNVFRRDGQPCPRCGTTIVKMTVAQRGTHLCPRCQQLV